VQQGSEMRSVRTDEATHASSRFIGELQHLESHIEQITFGSRRKAIKRATALKTVTEWSEVRLAMLKFTESGVYNVGMVLVIILNVVHLWIETDLRAENAEQPLFMLIASRTFLSLYTMDLLLRIYVYRRQFPKSGMNVFDSLVVVLDIFFALPGTTGNLPSMSILRGLRMLRIVRVIRNLVAFRELYLMMQGLVSAVRAIIFGTTLIVAILILFSVLAVELINEENHKLYQEGVYGDCVRCGNAFDTMSRAMMTFISTIIAGDSWGVICLPLMEREPWTALILLPALLCLELGLLNVVAAVIVDRQAQARQDDEKFLHQMREEDLKKSYGRLKALFSSMDDDGSGSLTLEEMIDSYKSHAEFKELMELMDIGPDDLHLVFAILDKDGSGDVTYDEFVEQLNTMRTTNSHTLLVFVKHLACRIAEQADAQEESLKTIVEGLGLAPSKQSQRIFEEDDWYQEPDRNRSFNDSIWSRNDLRNAALLQMVSSESGLSSVRAAAQEARVSELRDELQDRSSSRQHRASGVSLKPSRSSMSPKSNGVPAAAASLRQTSFLPAESAVEVHPAPSIFKLAGVTKSTLGSSWAARAVATSPSPGSSAAAAAADLNAKFLDLSRHIQRSLAAITEDAVRQAGDKALWESTVALATLQASLPLLNGASEPSELQPEGAHGQGPQPPAWRGDVVPRQPASEGANGQGASQQWAHAPQARQASKGSVRDRGRASRAPSS